MDKPLFDQTIAESLDPVLEDNQFANDLFDNDEFEEHLELIGGAEYIAEWADICELLHLVAGDQFKNPAIKAQVNHFPGTLLYDTTVIDADHPVPVSNYDVYVLIQHMKSKG